MTSRTHYVATQAKADELDSPVYCGKNYVLYRTIRLHMVDCPKCLEKESTKRLKSFLADHSNLTVKVERKDQPEPGWLKSQYIVRINGEIRGTIQIAKGWSQRWSWNRIGERTPARGSYGSRTYGVLQIVERFLANPEQFPSESKWRATAAERRRVELMERDAEWTAEENRIRLAIANLDQVQRRCNDIDLRDTRELLKTLLLNIRYS